MMLPMRVEAAPLVQLDAKGKRDAPPGCICSHLFHFELDKRNMIGTYGVQRRTPQRNEAARKRNGSMFAAFAVLAFGAAAFAAVAAIYFTVAPALPKIRAALSGAGTTIDLPPPARRASVMRVTVRSASARPTMQWRAAA